MSEAPRRARERRLRDQEAAETGFTLIELLVVLLIIATLVAIAVPRSLSRPKTANVRAAPANLLYTSDDQARIGPCARTRLSRTGAADTGLRAIEGTGPAGTVSFNPSGTTSWQAPGVAPGHGDCWMTVGEEATQPVATVPVSPTRSTTATCPAVTKRATASKCLSGSTSVAAGDAGGEST